MIEKSTTAGTMLLASEWKGFAGMYRSTKLNGARRSIKVVLKNDALSTSGKASGNRNAKATAMSQSTASTAPALRPRRFASSALSAPRLEMIEIIT